MAKDREPNAICDDIASKCIWNAFEKSYADFYKFRSQNIYIILSMREKRKIFF